MLHGKFIMTQKANLILFIVAALIQAHAVARESELANPLPTDQELAEELDDATLLIPEEAPVVREAAEASIARLDDAAKKAQAMLAKMSAASLAAREREKLREARSAIVQSPELQRLRTEIDESKTDEARRLARIAYYNALYDGMAKAVPSAKSTIQSLRERDLSRLEFNRIRSHEESAGGE